MFKVKIQTITLFKDIPQTSQTKDYSTFVFLNNRDTHHEWEWKEQNYKEPWSRYTETFSTIGKTSFSCEWKIKLLHIANIVWLITIHLRLLLFTGGLYVTDASECLGFARLFFIFKIYPNKITIVVKDLDCDLLQKFWWQTVSDLKKNSEKKYKIDCTSYLYEELNDND